MNGLIEAVHATDTTPDLADITKNVLKKHLATIRLSTSAATCNTKVKYLGAFFRAAAQRHHTDDPTKNLPRYHEMPAEADAPDRRPVTPEELGKVFAVASTRILGDVVASAHN